MSYEEAGKDRGSLDRDSSTVEPGRSRGVEARRRPRILIFTFQEADPLENSSAALTYGSTRFIYSDNGTIVMLLRGKHDQSLLAVHNLSAQT